MGIRFLLLLMIALAGFATPARANDICDRYSAELSPAETEDLRDSLMLLTPKRDVALLRSIEIMNVPFDDDHFAPSIVPAGRTYRIEIPAGYRRFSCQLTRLFLIFWLERIPSSEIAAIVDLCVSTEPEMSRIGCLHYVVDKFDRGMVEGGLGLEEQGQMLGDMADGAFFGMVGHELGHALKGHLRGKGKDLESEADSFVTIQSLLLSNDRFSDFGAIAVLSTLSIIDNQVDAGDSHGRFICRASLSKRILSMGWDRITAIRKWAYRAPEEYLQVRREPPGMAFMFKGTLEPAMIDRAGCPSAGGQNIGMIEADLDAILAALDGLTNAGAQGAGLDLGAFLDPLGRLRLRSEEGRLVRAAAVAARLRALSKKIGTGPGEISGSRLFDLVELAIAREGRGDISAGDYALLLAVRGGARFARLSQMKVQRNSRAELRLARGDFILSLAYDRTNPYAYFHLAMIDVWFDDCEAASKWLALAHRHARKNAEAGARADLEQFAKRFDTELAERGCTGIMSRLAD